MCGGHGPFQGAPIQVDNLMSTRNLFVPIESAIWLTDKEPPAYEDGFWEIRDVSTATLFGRYETQEAQDFMAFIRQLA